MACSTCRQLEYEDDIQNIRNRLKSPQFKFNFSCYKKLHNTVNPISQTISGIYEGSSGELIFRTVTPNNESSSLTEQELLERFPVLLIEYYEGKLSFIEIDGSVEHKVGKIVPGYVRESEIPEHVPKEIHYVKYENCSLFYLTSWMCESPPQWILSLELKQKHPKLLAEYLKKIIVWH